MASFFDGYVGGALWSSLDDDGDALDRNYSRDEIGQETLDHMRDDCERFEAENAATLAQCPMLEPFRAGMLFWLNRNGHGSGFWDEVTVPGALRERLSKAAHGFGEFELYVGDDGKVYGQ